MGEAFREAFVSDSMTEAEKRTVALLKSITKICAAISKVRNEFYANIEKLNEEQLTKAQDEAADALDAMFDSVIELINSYEQK